MADPRIKRLADILVNYSLKIKKNDIIVISSAPEAKPLILEVSRLIIKKEAFPKLNLSLEGFSYNYFRHASNAQLKTLPKISLYEAKNANGFLRIGADYNTKELSNIDPKKLSLRTKTIHPISEIILKKNNWVICEYPTNALAQDAEMSLEEFEDFAYSATNLDWKKEDKKQDKIKKVLDKGSHVRLVGEETDISFSIKDRTSIKCSGQFNMPDGEVFIAPVETTTKGKIFYSYPAIYNGKEVDDVRLWFEKGKVVKATAGKNQSLLNAMLNTDKGSRYLGEFGIGVNYGIKRFIKQILFDEKIGGTIHLALGRAYKQGGGRNESAIHWDMIKDMKKGEIQIDNKIIQKNGKFLI